MARRVAVCSDSQARWKSERRETTGRRMGKVENIESQIQELSPEELAALREWLARYDAEIRDRQFGADVKAGKLDALAERALRDHLSRRSNAL